MERRRFNGGEDAARNAIVKEMRRVKWEDVSKQLCDLGFPQRSKKSLRNRHLRQKQFNSSTSRFMCKNLCRKCGVLQRGHVCVTVDTVVDAEDEVVDPAQ